MKAIRKFILDWKMKRFRKKIRNTKPKGTELDAFIKEGKRHVVLDEFNDLKFSDTPQ